MNKLSCKSCGPALQVEGFDRRLAVVHCSHCGVLYDLTKSRTETDHTKFVHQTSAKLQFTGTTNSVSMEETESRPVAAMPVGFNVTSNGQLSVRWNWRSAWSPYTLAVSVLISLYVFYQFITNGAGAPQGIFIILGLGLLYQSVASVFNKTTVSVDDDHLKVRHSPLPWLPAPTIKTSSIEQLFVSEGYTKSKDGTTTPYYLLNAVLRDNQMKRLSTQLPNIEQALYLEQEFERALNIRDRRVAGEVRQTSRHI